MCSFEIRLPSRPRRCLVPVLVIVALIAFSMHGCAPAVSTAVREDCNDRVIAGSGPEGWYERSGWWKGNGSVYAVGRAIGHERESEVLTAAAAQAADIALSRLEARGIAFLETDRRRMVAESARAVVEEGLAEFPRLLLSGTWVRKCVRGQEGKAEWEGRVLVEYPISSIKGDLNNAGWHRRRSVREADVLIASARSFFAEGRWVDGLVELARARGILGEMTGSLDDSMHRAKVDSLAAVVTESFRIDPVSLPGVGEVGTHFDLHVEFVCTYEWAGGRIPAVGVPVVVEIVGAPVVVKGGGETDRDGIARAELTTTFGTAGKRAIVVSLDEAVIRLATRGAFNLARLAEATGHQAFYLAEGLHGTSICFELRSPGNDEASGIVEARCRSRLEVDGYAIEDCSADVDIVVRGEIVTYTAPDGNRWVAKTTVQASAFDQRIGRDVGEISFSVDESSDWPSEAEKIALTEAGRLLASYLTRRIILKSR